MRGNITRRGKFSWRLKFDVGLNSVTGKRKTRYVTVRGKRADAERELARLLNEVHNGTLIDPTKVTVAQHLRAWLGGAPGLSPKTAERYQQLAEQQIFPHLGAIALQKLRPAHIQDWHAKILRAGGKEGRPLSPRTVGHAHRVLHKALQLAVDGETLPRNVADKIPPPKVETEEVEILSAEQIMSRPCSRDIHSLRSLFSPWVRGCVAASSLRCDGRTSILTARR